MIALWHGTFELALQMAKVGMAIHIAVVIEDTIALNGETMPMGLSHGPSTRYMIVLIIFFVVKISLRKCTNGICLESWD